MSLVSRLSASLYRFNSKGVSHLLGHAKEIISVDVYGDTQEIIEDCLDVLEPFIEEVIPKERKDQQYDYSEVIEIISVRCRSAISIRLCRSINPARF